jgi:serine acetyltransferase
LRASTLASVGIQCVAFVLPWRIRRRLLNLLPGFRIHRGAKIGYSIFLTRQIVLEDGAFIGHLNLFKGAERIQLDPYAAIGHLNWVTGLARDDHIFYHAEPDRNPILLLKEHAAVTSRHYIDCSNKVEIGAFSIVAGVRSQILTHGIEIGESHQATAPVLIGGYCFIGTGSIILKGSSLAAYCVVGAGSVLRGDWTEEYSLLSGVPAKKVRDLGRDPAYFTRTIGFVA